MKREMVLILLLRLVRNNPYATKALTWRMCV